jgi:YHS domain-containing protein
MRRYLIFFLLGFVLFSAGSICWAEKLSNKICPIMGAKVNPKIFTEYEGKKVYFCCPGCIPMFKKNPNKYLGRLPQFAQEELYRLRAKLKRVFKEIAKKEKILHPKNPALEMTKLIYEETEKAFKETGREVKGLLPMHPDAFGNKIACPVMGTLFNIKEKSEKSDYQGKVYYFCCPKCKILFEKNPKKYLAPTQKK